MGLIVVSGNGAIALAWHRPPDTGRVMYHLQ
jgi:hypothetical protein